MMCILVSSCVLAAEEGPGALSVQMPTKHCCQMRKVIERKTSGPLPICVKKS